MRAVLWIFAVIGMLATLLVVLIMIGVAEFRPHAPALPQSVVLRLDLSKTYSEASEPDDVARLLGDKTRSFRHLIEAIRRAGEDTRVKGLVADTSGLSLGFAQTQELRAAVEAFRGRGKFAYAYSETFGELGGGTGSYLLATGFDSIWLQPVGSVGLVGIDVEAPFFKGLLDKIGVTAAISRRGEYKSAATQFTATHFPDSDKTALAGLTQSLFDQIVAGIAQGRHIDPAMVRGMIDEGPYLAGDAFAKHLVDRVGYRDELEAAALARAGGGEFVDMDRYERSLTPDRSTGATEFAMIAAAGAIVSGHDPDGPLSSGGVVASRDLVKALDDAAARPEIKAIILRIDSPGGSETASETIWRATQQARAHGKKLIVSMGDAAASGGYYIACGADRIVAEPGTLTGSIGVFGGKVVAGGLWDKIGVSWDGVQIGRNADMESSNHPFSPDQQARLEAMLDDSYRTFVARVADGRHMAPDRVDAIARGRVWSGQQAKELGLVDNIGGIETAIAEARKATNLAADAPVSLTVFPRPRGIFETLMDKARNEDDSDALGTLTLLGRADRLARMLEAWHVVLGSDDAAVMPPLALSH